MTGSQLRRAFACYKCTPPLRVFLLLGEPDRKPTCPVHGRMDQQPNVKYVKGRYIKGPKTIGLP